MSSVNFDGVTKYQSKIRTVPYLKAASAMHEQTNDSEVLPDRVKTIVIRFNWHLNQSIINIPLPSNHAAFAIRIYVENGAT